MESFGNKNIVLPILIEMVFFIQMRDCQLRVYIWMFAFIIVQDRISIFINDARTNFTQHTRCFLYSQVRNPLKISNVSPETTEGIK